ncbi:MAG: UDP-N-acetylmuramoyl-tripeptide--D-alanyl-D-alanine ligase [Clostridia bacterium]|nr:UDP-N-acetylmuramoyl-tripeptide--D-alanyl-D-alanine ligase [Clostridia bacterium]
MLAPWCVFSFGTSAMMLLLFAMPALSNFINFYDKIKNKKYIKNASLKLANSNAVKIAITGSNGKTSVKNILYQILSSKYNTLKTPASFNTPLGISKFINENLTDNCEFIILEYGARHKNDIQNLCNIFGADYGIITTVAPQHLESFKSLQNVCIAKSKLSSYLDNNYCIYNIDNLCCKRMYNNKIGKKVSTSIHEKADVYASEINIENFKTYFKLHTNNKTYNVSTSLLGRHNISNILQATALALSFDVDIKEIIQTIKDLKPTSHRLEYIKSHINILDDSYNCSIISAKESLYVLQQTNYKKMVVTPGIIEGGKKEYELNFKLGKMCAFCDYVVIVGNHNKQAITEGLKSKNYDIKKICYSPTLEDAKKYFTLLSDNDTLLLLNDLPDDYK